MVNYTTIVTATDFSELGERAVQRAQALAISAGAKLTVLHVVDPLPAPSPLYAHYDSSALREAADKAKEVAEQTLNERYGEKASCEVLRGDPSTEILAAAERAGADLLVLATNGRRGISRVVFGSVCERVMRLASCDMLIVR